MLKKISLLLSLFIVVACKNSQENEKDQIKSAHWLLGKWETKTAEGRLSENWSKLNDSTLQAVSYFIKAEDTLHFEQILLQQKGEDLLYKASVKGQNNDKAIVFTLTSKSPAMLVFENAKHDYPQKISYSLTNKDNIVASISGIQQGKASSERFQLKKMKSEK